MEHQLELNLRQQDDPNCQVLPPAHQKFNPPQFLPLLHFEGNFSNLSDAQCPTTQLLNPSARIYRQSQSQPSRWVREASFLEPFVCEWTGISAMSFLRTMATTASGRARYPAAFVSLTCRIAIVVEGFCAISALPAC